MRYVELELINYTRLKLADITRLVYKPENNVQLILGTNGSGKSSLLKELSPLPADMKKDYTKGGLKRITIYSNGKTYVLTSEYKSSIRHSFKMDDEELNRSGTKQIQLSLVKKHFGITPQIHDVMVGVKGFCNMGVADRKKWFNLLSNVDYTYALKVYNGLAEKLRDVRGAVKIQSVKLTTKESSILTPGEIDEIKKKLSVLKRYGEYLLDQTKDVNDDMPSIEDVERLISIHTEKLEDMLKLELDFQGTRLNLDNIDILILEHESTNGNLSSLATNTLNEIERIKKDLEVLKKSGSTSIKNLQTRLAVLTNEINDLANAIGVDLDGIRGYIATCNSDLKALDKVENLLYEYPPNAYIEYSTESIANIRSTLDDINYRINTLESDLSRVDERIANLEELRENDDIECPSCGHKWKHGYDAKLYKKILSRKDTILKELTTLQDKHKELTSQNEVCTQVENINIAIRDIVHAHPHMRWAWERLYKAISETKDYASSASIIYDLKQLYERIRASKNIFQEIDEVNKLLLSEEVGANVSITRLMSDLEYKESVYQDIAKKKKDNYDRLTYLRDTKQKLINIDKLHERLSSLMSLWTKSSKNELFKLHNTYLNDMLYEIRLEQSNLERQLTQVNEQLSIMADIKASLKELEDREKVLADGVRALSPTSGLIAKGIMGFLGAFTARMNEIIRSVWTYPLEVLPCTIDSETNKDLNYRFPIVVDNGSDRSDVSLGSASMQEIIDLAFKITSMEYLGMEHDPLYLDEFGRTMDTVHMKHAYDLVSELAKSDFEQIFMVSHFESCYGRFTNADIVVLSGDNLALGSDAEVNKVIDIK